MPWHDPACTVEGVAFDARSGLGAVPDGADIGWFGAVVLMRPSVYLSLAETLRRPRAESLAGLGEAVRSGRPLSPAFLRVAWPVRDGALPAVVGHEGRHRMMAVRAEVGDRPVPVHLMVRDRRASFLDAGRIGTLRAAMFDEDRLMRVEGPLFSDAHANGLLHAGPPTPAWNRAVGHVPFEPSQAAEAFLAHASATGAADLGEALAALADLDEDGLEACGAWEDGEGPELRALLREVRHLAARHGAGTSLDGLVGRADAPLRTSSGP